jgi:phosphatidylglycerophosphate synthase
VTAASASTAGIRRNADIEEPSNRHLIHPLSARLLPLLQRLDVHPNTVSISGAAAGVTGALAYHFIEGPTGIIAGLLCMLVWHVLDGADGQLARLTGKVTPLGFLLDGICDYVVFIAIYGVIGIESARTLGPAAWLIVGAGAVSHMIQAAAFELQRSAYLHWTNPAKTVSGAGPANPRMDRLSSGLKTLAAIYAAMQEPFRPVRGDLEAQLAAQAVAGRSEQVARAYDEAFRSQVKRWAVLSANQRTVAVFVAFLAAWPIGYPWAEFVLGNLALLLLLRRNRTLNSRLAANLALAG